jgi:hypothetical protein
MVFTLKSCLPHSKTIHAVEKQFPNLFLFQKPKILIGSGIINSKAFSVSLVPRLFEKILKQPGELLLPHQSSSTVYPVHHGSWSPSSTLAPSRDISPSLQ